MRHDGASGSHRNLRDFGGGGAILAGTGEGGRLIKLSDGGCAGGWVVKIPVQIHIAGAIGQACNRNRYLAGRRWSLQIPVRIEVERSGGDLTGSSGRAAGQVLAGNGDGIT